MKFQVIWRSHPPTLHSMQSHQVLACLLEIDNLLMCRLTERGNLDLSETARGVLDDFYSLMENSGSVSP